MKQMILIVGLDDKGKPHAAKFDFSQADAVRKAAALMDFRTALPKGEEGAALAERLPPGKIFAAGKGMVPFCKLATYEQLVKVVELEPPAPKIATPLTASQKSIPAAWDSLKVGDKVVAFESADDGWWPAVIVGVSSNRRDFKLRWVDLPKAPAFSRKRQQVSLLYPG